MRKGYRKSAEQRLPAAKRKYSQAISKFIKDGVWQHEETYYEYKVHKNSVEITTYFQVAGDPKKYRFDYEINLLEHLPRVDFLRNFMWNSFKDYKIELQSKVRSRYTNPAHTAI